MVVPGEDEASGDMEAPGVTVWPTGVGAPLGVGDAAIWVVAGDGVAPLDRPKNHQPPAPTSAPLMTTARISGSVDCLAEGGPAGIGFSRGGGPYPGAGPTPVGGGR